MNEISALRKRLGLSQAQFASFIGLSGKATVSRMENGKEPVGPRVQMTITDKIKILDLEEEIRALQRMVKRDFHEHQSEEPIETA